MRIMSFKIVLFSLLFFFSLRVYADGGVEVGERWEEVAFGQLTTSDVFVIVDVSSSRAMRNVNTTTNPKAVAVTLSSDDSYITSSVTSDMQWGIRKRGGSTYIQRFGESAAQGVLNNVSGTAMRVGNVNDYTGCLLSWSAAATTLRFTGNGQRYIEHSANDDWRAYVDKTTATSLKFYKKVEISFTSVNISAAGYGTFYTDGNFVMPSGLEGAVVRGVRNGDRLNIDYCYAAGDVVPARTGLLLRGAQGRYQVVYTDKAAKPVDGENFLKGSVEAALTEGDDCDFYKLSYNSENAGELGFYYGAEDGAPFMNGAYKAYLALPRSLNVRSLGFSLDAGTSSGIVLAPTTGGMSVIHELGGRRLYGASPKNLGKGIYIIDGKKVIVK